MIRTRFVLESFLQDFAALSFVHLLFLVCSEKKVSGFRTPKPSPTWRGRRAFPDLTYILDRFGRRRQ